MKPRRRSSSNHNNAKSLEEKNKDINQKTKVRMQRYRQKLYSDKKVHEQLKQKDRLRKKKSSSQKKPETDQQTRERRKKEREKKRAQRAKQKEKDNQARSNEDPILALENIIDEERRKKKNICRNLKRETQRLKESENILKVKVKALTSKIRRKRTYHPASPSSSLSSSDINLYSSSSASPNTSSCEERTPLAKQIYSLLSPGTKQKTKRALSINKPVGFSKKIRTELGINIHKTENLKSTDKSALCKEVEKFFQRPDITKICPDKKKIVTDPSDKSSKVQVQYRMGTLKTLHHKFEAENKEPCSLSSFKRYVPFNVQKPKPNDWGTCLCSTCLNPSLKFQRLIDLNLIPHCDLEERFDSDEEYAELIESLKSAKTEQKRETITFQKWEKVDNPILTKSGKKANPVTKKVSIVLSYAEFFDQLLSELATLKEHYHRIHMQYRAFKQARIQASENEQICTIQIDWSENARLRQAAEERSAYYHEDNLSIHAMHAWYEDNESSFVSISDNTAHHAPSVWASLEPILNDLVSNIGVSHLNIISDSPSNQYRNKSIFWFIKEYAEKKELSIKWIFLEAGHGKGIPDGIGATVKKSIDNLIADNPEEPVYCVKDLMSLRFESYIPSIAIYHHTTEDIARCREMLPDKLVPAPDSMKLHEVNVDHEGDYFTLSYKIDSSQPKKKFDVIPAPPSIKRTASSRTFTKKEVEEQSTTSNVNLDFEPGEKVMKISTTTKDSKEQQPVKKQKKCDPLQKRLDEIKKSLDDDKKGFYYAVFYSNDYYWGKVLNVFCNDSDEDAETVEMTFLRYKSDGLWVFPKEVDKEIVSVNYLFLGPVSPAVTSVSGFRFNEKDIEAKKVFKLFQKSNIYNS